MEYPLCLEKMCQTFFVLWPRAWCLSMIALAECCSNGASSLNKGREWGRAREWDQYPT